MANGVSKDPLARLAERAAVTTPETERALQAAIKETVHKLGGDTLRRALHGDWLNEPLHVILTDVPVGSWTGTIAFDSVAAVAETMGAGSAGAATAMNVAADATLWLGLLGAVGAAVTGMNDWSEIEKPAARKIGLVHAVLNMTATGLYAASAIARLRKARGTGRALGAAGYALVSVSAHLGGNMIYEHGIGVLKPGENEVTEAMRG